uniref:Integrase catalytic domain-containing protein n=1 Tax=Glossina palpalis gambiensis TaxID=67801 RepID=A0A1B0C2J8_9MUSC
MSIHKTTTTPYYPLLNSIAERLYKRLKASILPRGNASNELPTAPLGLRPVWNQAVSETPTKMVYRQNACFPAEYSFQGPISNNQRQMEVSLNEPPWFKSGLGYGLIYRRVSNSANNTSNINSFIFNPEYLLDPNKTCQSRSKNSYDLTSLVYNTSAATTPATETRDTKTWKRVLFLHTSTNP